MAIKLSASGWFRTSQTDIFTVLQAKRIVVCCEVRRGHIRALLESYPVVAQVVAQEVVVGVGQVVAKQLYIDGKPEEKVLERALTTILKANKLTHTTDLFKV